MDNTTETQEYGTGNIVINDTINGIPLVEMTKDDMIRSVTEEYLRDIEPDSSYDMYRLKADLVDLIYAFVQQRNKSKNCQKWRSRDTLYPIQIAMIIKHMYNIVNINMAGKETKTDPKYTVLGVYQDNGENEGIYITHDSLITNIIYQYNALVTEKEEKEVIKALRALCDTVYRCDDPDLIAIQNGIFNYKTKQCMPFSPEYVFTAKCNINYNPCATNPIIHNPDDGTDWDVESWMSELFEDEPEVVTTLWQVIGAAIRPNVPWNKAIWLLSTRGNNGKGTLCELIRNLVGRESYTSIRLTDFSKDFALEPLVSSTAIITDENDVGTYIDQAANLKAIITGDTIQITRKFMSSVAYQFRGLMIQCINEVPKIRDRSESFYRRQLIIKFQKSYTGMERKYIKEDYFKRTEVLEYVLYKVLNMDYYEINEPEYCKEIMSMYKVHNDPVRDFMNDVIPQFSISAVPNNYLYALYGKWLEKNNPSAKRCMLGKTNFLSEAKDLIGNFPEWEFPKSHFRIKQELNTQELTLAMYDIKEWMTDPDSTDNDVKYRLKWNKVFMDGMIRKTNASPNKDNDDKEEEIEYADITNGFGKVIEDDNDNKD